MGDPFLNPDTEEDDRWVSGTDAGSDSAGGFRVIFDAAAPSGTLLQGHLTTYAKNGELPDSQGVYGAGDVCLLGAAGLG